MDTTVIIVVVMVVGLVVISALIVGVIIIRRKRATKKHNLEDKTSSLKHDSNYFGMDDTPNNCNNNGFEVGDSAEVNLDNDDVPDLNKESSLTENNNYSPCPKEATEQVVKSSVLRSFLPTADANDATSDHSPGGPDATSAQSANPNNKLDTTNEYATVVPNEHRKDGPKKRTGDRNVGEIIRKPLGNKFLKQTAEPDVRDSVPYSTPADSIKLPSSETAAQSLRRQANDDDPYALPADAIQNSARKTYPNCVPDEQMKVNELYTTPTRDEPKCVPEELMEDNALYNMSTRKEIKGVPDEQMKVNEIYNI